jgi:hypothetical protein
MSLRIESEPVQTFAALFDLRGSAERATSRSRRRSAARSRSCTGRPAKPC